MTDRTRAWPDAPAVESAARTVLHEGLRGKRSAFTQGMRAWQSDASGELMRLYVGQPNIGGGSYDEKLDSQLATASDEAILLFAELSYLCVLPLADYRAESKRALVDGLLARMENSVALPETLSKALDGGIFGGGVAFKTRRYWQLCYLIEFAHGFLTDPPTDEVWSDPVAFRMHLDRVTSTNAPSQRHALLYLAFPDHYAPIVSVNHRRAILRRFADILEDESDDEDVNLAVIRRELSRGESAPFDFYREPWRRMWDPAEQVSEGQGRRAWLVRGSSVDGHDLIPTWLDEGFASLRAAKLREVEAGIDREWLKKVVDEDYSQTSYAAKAAKLDEFHAFLSRMRVGDAIATTSQGKLYAGTIAEPAEYIASEDGLSNLRRAVEWTTTGHDYSTLAPELKARLQVQYDVVELTQQLDLLDELVDPPSPVEEKLTAASRELVLPDATDELAEQLHVDRAWIQECIELLRDRPQIIFYGPPGTGKTYLAQHLAEYLAGDNVRLVQFHPAYSYEDFSEGYRPLEEGGFKLKPGPLRKVVDAARENPSTPYFLIIDEINRGNLAKIFGELYFLLEYRSQNVDLLYATDDDVGFTLPENVFLIGTMNTADRSIALVDAAMRRRFAFVPLHPAEPPTSDILRRWLAATGRDMDVAELLDELNARIEDDDFKIGPSYFMRAAVHDAGGLERAWRTAILPLLEEHHYGDGVDVRQRYGLDAIRSRVAQRSDEAVTSNGDQPADPA